jgi:hypothetical protein
MEHNTNTINGNHLHFFVVKDEGLVCEDCGHALLLVNLPSPENGQERDILPS